MQKQLAGCSIRSLLAQHLPISIFTFRAKSHTKLTLITPSMDLTEFNPEAGIKLPIMFVYKIQMNK